MENKDQFAFPFHVSTITTLTKREYFTAMADVPWSSVLDSLRFTGHASATLEQFIAQRARMMIMQADEILRQLSESKSDPDKEPIPEDYYLK